MRSMQVGDRVRVRNEDRPVKISGRVTSVRTSGEPLEVTRSGLFGGPDAHRVAVPGRTSMLITIEVEIIEVEI